MSASPAGEPVADIVARAAGQRAAVQEDRKTLPEHHAPDRREQERREDNSPKLRANAL